MTLEETQEQEEADAEVSRKLHKVNYQLVMRSWLKHMRWQIERSGN